MITIIDAPCGAGKTTWAIQEINQNADKGYIYCTPYLDEITRIKDSTAIGRLKEPEYYINNGENFSCCAKIDSFNYLLEMGADIAVTHTTFLNATNETIENIRDGEYTLILDEALEAIQEFNEIQEVTDNTEQKVLLRDIQNLISSGYIRVDEETKRVDWIGDSWEGGKFSVLEKMTRTGRVYYTDQKVMVCIYPPEIFRSFDAVYVMTYLFGGSQLKAYFDCFGLDYEVRSIETAPDGSMGLCPYNDEADFQFRDNCKKLINIISDQSYKRSNSLSKKWYKSMTSEQANALKGKIRYHLTKRMEAKAPDIMWTCPKDYRPKLTGKGYTEIRRLTSEEKKLPDKERKQLESELSCFVSCNARATNKYRDRWALAYCCNMFPRPEIENFFIGHGFRFGRDAYAISCLIQWIFRSRIREGKPITVYLPSKRMANLLESWLDHKKWE